MNHSFDTIGRGYSLNRRADPRIARQNVDAKDDVVTVVSVGPSTGSYELPHLAVSVAEPSIEIIRQRAPRRSFDALMALPLDPMIVGMASLSPPARATL
jgi:hypothetical protein